MASGERIERTDTLFWAIGSPTGLRSSAWFLRGDEEGDIYYGTRSLGGTYKVSLHRDGRCYFGFSKKYRRTARERFGVRRREVEEWTLPPDEVVKVQQVMIPHSSLRSYTDAHGTELVWLPPPQEGWIVRTSVRAACVVYARSPIDIQTAQVIDRERKAIKADPRSHNFPKGTRAALSTSSPDHRNRIVLELACDYSSTRRLLC